MSSAALGFNPWRLPGIVSRRPSLVQPRIIPGYRTCYRPRFLTKCTTADSHVKNGDNQEGAEVWDAETSQALLRGGEEIVGILETMIKVLEDVTGLDKDAEDTAIQMAAVAAIGQRLDKLDGSFLAALEILLTRSQLENDPKKKELLEIIKETTLAQVTAKASPEVQIVAILCQAPDKEHRRQILRRAAAGGGLFGTNEGGKINIPGGDILNVANQADDIISSMEEKERLPDRILLAKLVLVRELAHDMMGGGFLDGRNKSPFQNLSKPEVDFLAKLVSQRPGPSIRERLDNVLRGRDEGSDSLNAKGTKGETGAVRPGIFMQTVKKLLDGMYSNRSAAGITVQHLDWVYRNGLEILQDIAFGKYGAAD